MRNIFRILHLVKKLFIPILVLGLSPLLLVLVILIITPNFLNYKLFESSITDWLQAFGSLIAICAAIYAFTQLNNDNKEKQSQINSLVNLAKQSSKQTGHLSEQVDQMIEANKIQSNYVMAFEKLVLTTEQNYQLKKDKEESESIFKKKALKPKLVLADSRLIEAIIECTIVNTCGKAIFQSLKQLEGSGFQCSNVPISGFEILQQRRFTLNFTRIELALNISKGLEHRIYYSDALGNEYYQDFEGSGKTTFKLTEPKEIPK